MSFFEHLGDLRRALFRMAAAYAAAMALVFPFIPRIYGWLTIPLSRIGRDPDVFLRQSPEPAAAMHLAMSVDLWSALVLALPFMLTALAGFVFPGLTARERRVVTVSLLAGTVLFALGVALGIGLMLEPSLRIMLWFSQWMGLPVEFWWAGAYIRFILMILAAFGLTFQLPLAVMLLGRLGVLTSLQLRAKRRHAIVFILILAAIVTPTQDPLSLLIMAAPLTLLYEISIWTTWAAERKRGD